MNGMISNSLKLADHLVILKDGHIVRQGEPQTILLEPTEASEDGLRSN